MANQPERDKLLDRIEEAIESFNPGYGEYEGWDSRKMADAALRVIETRNVSEYHGLEKHS